MKSSIKAILIAVCSVMMCTAAAGSRGKVTVRTMLACQGALTRDGKAEKALFPGGYASLQGGVAFHFYTSDYLGNVRAVTNASTGAVEQAVAYYPYGGIIADLGTGHAFQPYKFGEKELVTANGLNEYDFGARRYYQAVPMFTSPDPSSEKYPWLSPYLYCAGDPVNAIDPTGSDTISVNKRDGVWSIIETKKAFGDDIINVTSEKGKGDASYIFNKGEYGKRIVALNLEITDDYAIGVMHVSGEDQDGTFLYVTPGGESSNKLNSNKRMDDGIYPITTPGGTEKWRKPGVGGNVVARGIRFHYGNH